MSDKRQFERAEFGGEVEVELAGEWSRARLRDISVGGAYVLTEHPANFGDPVKLKIFLPAIAEKGLRVLDGTVRWTRTDGFGIQFGATGAVDTYGLAALVAKKSLGV